MPGPSETFGGENRASAAFTDYMGVLLWPPRSSRKAPSHAGYTDGDATMVISLQHYFSVLRAHWRPAMVLGILAMLLAIVYLHVATYRYTVSLTVAPVQQQGSSSSASGLAGLASLAGVNLPGSNSQTQLQLYLASLKSPDVAANLSRDPSISHVLFHDEWDPVAGRWHNPGHGLLGTMASVFKSILGYPPNAWHPPGTREMLELLEKQIDVNSAPLSPIVTISYDNKDPVFAEKFVLALHKAADDHLRALTVVRTTKYNEYLLRQLQTVTSADQRQAIILSLSNNETMLTQASADVSYSVDVSAHPRRPPSQRPQAAGRAAGIPDHRYMSWRRAGLWRCS